MPTNRELLESLRRGFEQLVFEDDNGLNRLEYLGRMRIRRVFGENSDYYSQFVNIQFSYYVSGVTKAEEYKAWQSGRDQVLGQVRNLL